MLANRLTKRRSHLLAMATATVTGVAALAMATSLTGCTQSRLKGLVDREQEARAIYTATTQAADALQTQIAALPADAPEKSTMQKRLDQLIDLEQKTDRFIQAADKAVAALRDHGTFDPTDPAWQPIAQAIPYGSAILATVGLVWGLVNQTRSVRTGTALASVVRSVEAVLPNKPPALKAAMAAVQGPSVSALVDDIKKRLNTEKPTEPQA